MTDQAGDIAPVPPGLPLWLTDPLTAVVLRCARHLPKGALRVTLPDGNVCRLGDPSEPPADLVLRSPRAVRRLVLGGAVGFAEAYVAGAWDSADLPALLELMARNAARLRPRFAALAPGGWLDRLAHLGRRNTRRGSRRNIAAHYDLGNDFYRLWLDRGMTYSAALYVDDAWTLEQAQAAKIARIADLVGAAPDRRLLEIGCGWGGMAEYLVRERGCAVTAITLSRAQFELAAARVGAAADVRLQDYREVRGSYDGIVSVEMIEAVGEGHWPAYFAVLRDRLRPGGAAVLQAITIADDRFARYRRRADFIQRHVFPGGVLPSPGVIRAQVAGAGLALDHVETFGESYARTLAEWRRRFLLAWPAIGQLGFDARFRRLWDYYLAYCEAGFRSGAVDVGLYRLRRP